MGIPEDFASLLPLGVPKDSTHQSNHESDGPIYYLWVFDPHEDRVHLEHNDDRHPAHHVDHAELAERVPHPDRIHGYAYRIKGGFRVTDWEHRPVDDPHVRKLVELALKGEKHEAQESSQAQSRALR